MYLSIYTTLLLWTLQTTAFLQPVSDRRHSRSLPLQFDGQQAPEVRRRILSLEEEQLLVKRDDGGINYNPDGTPFVWLSEDNFQGKNFFDDFIFFGDYQQRDPTNGHVNYVGRNYAFDKKLAYVSDDNKVIMKTDSWSKLPLGSYRDSVRIETNKTYTTGLFIIDIDKAPWGCAVWPGFWSTGRDWPRQGEIDILEGVHDNEHNQIAWHTTSGCYYDPASTFTGSIPNDKGVNRTNCDHDVNENAGCNVVEWSRASYGPYFEAQGGGVVAMKWDENDISVWSFFRAAIPKDITAGAPNPNQWGTPSARLLNTKCNITQYFQAHTIVFDITLCGDWAGNSYASTNCPGTCDERLVDGGNFVNSSWSVNSLKTYSKHLLAGNITQASHAPPQTDVMLLPMGILLLIAALSGTLVMV